MEEKKQLNFIKKVIYGFGDLGGNFLAIFIGAYIMIYLSNTIGLNTGIIGTLMLVARIFDGITDVFIGSMIDHTHTKYGKARPWQFVSTFLCAIGIVAIYSMPANASSTVQYAYFFIVYVLTNAFFYTANNIAYSTLSALITKNSEERVQLGTARYVCSTLAVMIILSVSIPLVTFFGGGAAGWRTVALLYAAVFLVLNLICVVFLKEVPENNNLENADKKQNSSDVSFIDTMKILLKSKKFLLILAVYFLMYLWTGMISSLGTYYMTYVIGNVSYLGMFSTAQNLATMAALVCTPFLVNKVGIHKGVLASLVMEVIAAGFFAFTVMNGKFSLVIVAVVIMGFFSGPLMGSLSATVASIGEYIFLEKGKHVEGSLFSCSSIGIKVGSGIGGAIVGWALALSGFDGLAAVQPESAIFMMKALFGFTPIIVYFILTVCFSKLNMQKAIEKLRSRQGK